MITSINEFKILLEQNTNNDIVYYHGTYATKKFKNFKNDIPIWFTKNEQYANAFTNGKGTIISAYLKMINTIYVGDIDGISNNRKLEKLSELTKIDIDILKYILMESNGVNLFNITNSSKFKDILIDKGYDSIEAREGNTTSYAVLNSNQIQIIKQYKYN